MTQFGNVVSAWLPIVAFPQVEAPKYHKGWITLCAINASLIISTLFTWQLQKEDATKSTAEDTSDNESTGVVTVDLAEKS
jgi:hypothetical protein